MEPPTSHRFLHGGQVSFLFLFLFLSKLLLSTNRYNGSNVGKVVPVCIDDDGVIVTSHVHAKCTCQGIIVCQTFTPWGSPPLLLHLVLGVFIALMFARVLFHVGVKSHFMQGLACMQLSLIGKKCPCLYGSALSVAEDLPACRISFVVVVSLSTMAIVGRTQPNRTSIDPVAHLRVFL